MSQAPDMDELASSLLGADDQYETGVTTEGNTSPEVTPVVPVSQESKPDKIWPQDTKMPTFRPLFQADKLYAFKVDDVEMLMANPRRVAPDIARIFLANRTPITTWGPVGSRKTRTIEAFRFETDEYGTPYQVITIQPSTQDSAIIQGMMYTSLDDDGTTVMKRSVPDVAQQVMRYWEECRGLTILYADEMTTCMPSQQNALLGLLTHGKFESLDISPYMTVIMAANPEGTVSTVTPLGEAVINRGGHIAWYGDKDLFLEEWGSGFNGNVEKPHPTTYWYIDQLLNSGIEPFRAQGRWSPDSLVPWDLFEHSERSVTELGKIMTSVNDLMSTRPDAIRRFYLVEVTKALLGREWATKMAAITNTEHEQASPVAVVGAVRESGLRLDATYEQVAAMGPQLHGMPSGETMRSDAQRMIITHLVESAYVERTQLFSMDNYVAAWIFILSAGDLASIMTFHSEILALVQVAATLRQNGVLHDSMPAFLTEEVKGAIRNAAQRAREVADVS